jgi:hypothetical protein
MAEKTEEQVVAEKLQAQLSAAGFQDGTPPDREEESVGMLEPAAPAAEAKEEEKPKDVPKTPETPAISAEEMKALRDKAEWAERSQRALETERREREDLKAEVARLRTALGQPTQTPHTLTADEQKAEEISLAWGKQYLPRLLQDPEIVKAIPENVLAEHPVVKKLAIGMWGLNDQLEQSQFLSQFELKDRATVQAQIIPVLRQARQASGYTKGYTELFEDMKEARKRTADVFGESSAPPSKPSPAPPPTTPTPSLTIPPSLSGVTGGPATPKGTKAPPIDATTARMLGQA